jgi:hypothetical protein
MERRHKSLVAVAAACTLFGAVAGAQLDSILKGGGAVLVVSKFGNDINKFINGITGVKQKQATKVVPIVSLGDGGFIGAVQVAGPAGKVETVKAVAQLEGRFKLIGGLRVRALVPIATDKPGSSIDRVDGVGVSAIVDVKL